MLKNRKIHDCLQMVQILDGLMCYRVFAKKRNYKSKFRGAKQVPELKPFPSHI